MKKFEYLVCSVNSSGGYSRPDDKEYSQLGSLGAEGWELVAVVAIPDTDVPLGCATAYFKREIEEPLLESL